MPNCHYCQTELQSPKISGLGFCSSNCRKAHLRSQWKNAGDFERKAIQEMADIIDKGANHG